jgi:hypothetical protein
LVESDDDSYKAEACSKLLSLLETLKVAQEQYGWDLAQLCIETCGPPIEKLVAVNSDLLNTEQGRIPDAVGGEGGVSSQAVTLDSNGTVLQNGGTAQSANDSVAFPLDLDIPWDYLWDDMIEPWPVE